MKQERATIQFCGFGGQGIVLSSVILGTAVVTRADLNAVQTQSYGSEARGGECQAERILAQGPIFSPLADDVQVLVAMSQSALDRYLERLQPGARWSLIRSWSRRPSERTSRFCRSQRPKSLLSWEPKSRLTWLCLVSCSRPRGF